jgi:hypothetical protein
LFAATTAAQEHHTVSVNLKTGPILTVLALPAAGAQSAFHVHLSPFGQKLVALFGELTPGGYPEPLRFVALVSGGGRVSPIGGYAEARNRHAA